MDDRRLRFLVLEPYYGGSHKRFLDGLCKLPFEFECLTLPARKWKWRMRLAGPFFAEKLRRMNRRFDRILCSDFVDVAAFRGLAPAWVREVPLLTYFHENQFAYPCRADEERDCHFSLTNLTTALASEGLAFNSNYNMTSFLEGTEQLLKQSCDLKLDNLETVIRTKSRILPPGIDFSEIDAAPAPAPSPTPVILWNHRWEHDKNPECFFTAAFQLDREGIDFRLVVLGQSYRNHPSIFDEARNKLSHRILHVGYAESPRDYARWLKRADIAVSTARHEFFGISMIEAVRAGCRPLAPRALSYPELLPDEFLYNQGEFVPRLKQAIERKNRLAPAQAEALTGDFSWDSLSEKYCMWLTDHSTGGESQRGQLEDLQDSSRTIRRTS